VIAALVAVVLGPVLAGESLTPRTNALIAFCVFGGLLGFVPVVQRRRVSEDDDSGDI
jgi:hypothetical protein